MNTLLGIYGTPGAIILGITAILWASSHIFAFLGLKELDFSTRILGFIGVIAIYITSGWKGGLLSIPIIIVISIFGAWAAKKLMTNLEEK